MGQVCCKTTSVTKSQGSELITDKNSLNENNSLLSNIINFIEQKQLQVSLSFIEPTSPQSLLSNRPHPNQLSAPPSKPYKLEFLSVAFETKRSILESHLKGSIEDSNNNNNKNKLQIKLISLYETYQQQSPRDSNIVCVLQNLKGNRLIVYNFAYLFPIHCPHIIFSEILQYLDQTFKKTITNNSSQFQSPTSSSKSSPKGATPANFHFFSKQVEEEFIFIPLINPLFISDSLTPSISSVSSNQQKSIKLTQSSLIGYNSLEFSLKLIFSFIYPALQTINQFKQPNIILLAIKKNSQLFSKYLSNNSNSHSINLNNTSIRVSDELNLDRFTFTLPTSQLLLLPPHSQSYQMKYKNLDILFADALTPTTPISAAEIHQPHNQLITANQFFMLRSKLHEKAIQILTRAITSGVSQPREYSNNLITQLTQFFKEIESQSTDFINYNSEEQQPSKLLQVVSTNPRLKESDILDMSTTTDNQINALSQILLNAYFHTYSQTSSPNQYLINEIAKRTISKIQQKPQQQLQQPHIIANEYNPSIIPPMIEDKHIYNYNNNNSMHNYSNDQEHQDRLNYSNVNHITPIRKITNKAENQYLHSDKHSISVLSQSISPRNVADIAAAIKSSQPHVQQHFRAAEIPVIQSERNNHNINKYQSIQNSPSYMKQQDINISNSNSGININSREYLQSSPQTYQFKPHSNTFNQQQLPQSHSQSAQSTFRGVKPDNLYQNNYQSHNQSLQIKNKLEPMQQQQQSYADHSNSKQSNVNFYMVDFESQQQNQFNAPAAAIAVAASPEKIDIQQQMPHNQQHINDANRPSVQKQIINEDHHRQSSYISFERGSYISQFTQMNTEPNLLNEDNQDMPANSNYSTKLNRFQGAILGSQFGDSLGFLMKQSQTLRIMSKKQFNRLYDSATFGKLSSWGEISLEIGEVLAQNGGVYDWRTISRHLIQWYDTRPMSQEIPSSLRTALKQGSSLIDDYEDVEVHRIVKEALQAENKHKNYIDVLSHLPFLALYCSMIFEEDSQKIIASHLSIFSDASNTLILHTFLIFTHCIKTLFTQNSSRLEAFTATLAYSEFQLKNNQLTSLLKQSQNPTQKQFTEESLRSNPIEFIVYLSFYLLYHNYDIEFALQTTYSFAGIDHALCGSIIGCLIGSATGKQNLPQQKSKRILAFNPADQSGTTPIYPRPEKYSPQFGINYAQSILELYIKRA